MKKLIFTCLFFQLLSVTNAANFDELKKEYADCFLKQTGTYCFSKAILSKEGTEIAKLKKDRPISNKANNFNVQVPNDNWLSVTETNEQLILVEHSKRAILFFNIAAHSGFDTNKKALETVSPIAEKIGAKPTKHELDIWPFNEDGAVYELCYKTKFGTSQCTYSFATRMKDIFISGHGMSNIEDDIFEQIIHIIATLNLT